MFCSMCGTTAAEGAHFCHACGAPLSAPGSGPLAPQYPVAQPPYPTGQPPGTLYPQHVLPAQPAPPDQPPAGRKPRGAGSRASADPRKQQLRALKLELKRLRIEMQQVNAQLSQIRNKYGQGRPFVPWGLGNRIYHEVENLELRNPQQRKQILQQQIIQIEQQILALESQINT
jgi:hypothetical protein